MGNGISIVALPQWYREWGLRYGKRGFETASKSLKWDKSQDDADLSGKASTDHVNRNLSQTTRSVRPPPY